MKGILGAVSRRPVITAAAALFVLSMVVVRATWDANVLPQLSGALILDDLRLAAFHHGDAAVGRAQVDTDYFCHSVCLYPQVLETSKIGPPPQNQATWNQSLPARYRWGRPCRKSRPAPREAARFLEAGVGFMRLPILVLALASLAACSAKAPAVDDAWVRLPAVPGRPGAAYFTMSAGAEPVTLLSVRTPAAVRTELHESMTGHAGMASMAPIAQVAVPAGETLRFAPGGKHVMLYDVNPALKPGAQTELTLALADGSTLAAKARVVGAGDAAPAADR